MSGTLHRNGDRLTKMSPSLNKYSRNSLSTNESSPEQLSNCSCNKNPTPIQNTRPQLRQNFESKQHPMKMKVQLCKNFLATGLCPYGSKCRFAHGLNQLLLNNQLSEHFRTKNCKAFYVGGQCRYGNRCNFKHDDRKLIDIHKEMTSKSNLNIVIHYPEVLVCLSKKPLFSFSKIPNQENTYSNDI